MFFAIKCALQIISFFSQPFVLISVQEACLQMLSVRFTKRQNRTIVNSVIDDLVNNLQSKFEFCFKMDYDLSVINIMHHNIKILECVHCISALSK